MGIEARDAKLAAGVIVLKKTDCGWEIGRPRQNCDETENVAKLLHFRHTLVTNARHVAFGEAASALRIIELRLHGKSPWARLIMNSHSFNDKAISNQSMARRRSAQSASKRRPKRTKPPEIDASAVELRLPGIGTMARTKRLILAALRVWELKRGIRD